MLIELFGENFGCFRDEFRLSMLATDIDPGCDRGIIEVAVKDDPEPLRLLRAAAIYGPNASGKTTVLRAADALHSLIANSGRFPSDAAVREYQPFVSNFAARRPVRLGVKAVLDSIIYDYEIAFNDKAFTAERLERQTVDATECLFSRLGQEVTGSWTDDNRFKLISWEFRQNALLLSLADSLAPGLVGAIASGLGRLLQFFDGTESPLTLTLVPRKALSDPQFHDWLLSQLKSADLGVTDMAIEKRAFQFPNAPTIPDYRLMLKHAGSDGAFQLPYESESFGTQKMADIAPILYELSNGQHAICAFVDEIGASLHPTLLRGLIQHFNCEIPASEARGQLIFATHETSLIDDEAKKAVLRRDQVYLTEKDASGAARLYSVAEFKERNNLNMRKRYLEGRYGAIPSLGRFPG